MVGERNGLPVELRVDDVGLDAAHGLLPALTRQVLDVPEGERTYAIEPIGVGRPQAVEGVPALLQRENALGVVGEFAHQQDLQPIGSRRRGGALSKRPVVRRLVDAVADRRVEAQRTGHMIARAVGVEPAERFADDLVALVGVVDPLTGDLIRTYKPAVRTRLVPIHAREIVGDKFLAWRPLLVHATVRHLHELQAITLDDTSGRPVVVVAHAGVGQHSAVVVVQGRHEGDEMVSVVDVIGGQVGHKRGVRRGERPVKGDAEALIAVQTMVVYARIGEVRRHQRPRIVGGAVVYDDEFPIGEGLRDEAVEGAADERSVPIGGHQNRNGWRYHQQRYPND